MVVMNSGTIFIKVLYAKKRITATVLSFVVVSLWHWLFSLGTERTTIN